MEGVAQVAGQPQQPGGAGSGTGCGLMQPLVTAMAGSGCSRVAAGFAAQQVVVVGRPHRCDGCCQVTVAGG